MPSKKFIEEVELKLKKPFPEHKILRPELTTDQLSKMFDSNKINEMIEEFRKEENMLNWSTDALLKKTSLLNVKQNDELDNIREEVVQSLNKSLKILKITQKYEDSKKIFAKITDNYSDLLAYCYGDDSPHIMIQFFRFVTFLYVFVDIIDGFEASIAEQYGDALNVWTPQSDAEETRFCEDLKKKLLKEISLRIVGSRIRVSFPYYTLRTDLPLQFDDSLPEELKDKYFVSSSFREKIKEFPEFFARFLLKDEERVRFTNRSSNKVIHLYLNGLGLRNLPEEISYFSSLKILNLAANNLTDLPDSLGELTSLRELNLELNFQMVSIPEVVHQLLARGVQVKLPHKLTHNDFKKPSSRVFDKD